MVVYSFYLAKPQRRKEKLDEIHMTALHPDYPVNSAKVKTGKTSHPGTAFPSGVRDLFRVRVQIINEYRLQFIPCFMLNRYDVLSNGFSELTGQSERYTP